MSGHLRFGQGLLPGLPLPAAVGGCCGAVRKGSFPFLGCLGPRMRGGCPFLFFPVTNVHLECCDADPWTVPTIRKLPDAITEVHY